MVQQGIEPVIDTTLPLEQARDGFAKMAAGDLFGKVVFTIDNGLGISPTQAYQGGMEQFPSSPDDIIDSRWTSIPKAVSPTPHGNGRAAENGQA